MSDQQYTVEESNVLYEEGMLPGAKAALPPPEPANLLGIHSTAQRADPRG